MNYATLNQFLDERNQALMWSGHWTKLDPITQTLDGYKPNQEVKVATIRGLEQWVYPDRFGYLVKRGLAYQTTILPLECTTADVTRELNRIEQSVFTALMANEKTPLLRRWFFGAGKRKMWHTGWVIKMHGSTGYQLEATIVGTLTV